MATLPFDYGQDEQDYLGLLPDPETGLPRTLLAQAQPRPGRALPKSMGMVTNTAATAPAAPTQQQAPQQPAQQAPQSALSQLPDIYKQADEMRNAAYDKLTPSDADLEQYRRSGTLGQLAGIAMQMLGNESQQAIGGNVLKQSMAELEKGKRDPWKVGEMEAKKLEAQAAALEKRAQYAVTIEEKREATRHANELKAEAMQLRADMHRQSIEVRQAIHASSQAGRQPNLQRAGTTPSGELVTFNPHTGQQMVNGQPYNGPVMSQAALDKQANTVQEALAGAANSKALLERVRANPKAFGGMTSLAPFLGVYAGTRLTDKQLTPTELQTRAEILREAAQISNAIYGAAQSAGEQARAATFLPNASDPPEVVMQKLQANMAWAEGESRKYGSQVRGTAEARSGPGTGGTLPPNVTVRETVRQ